MLLGIIVRKGTRTLERERGQAGIRHRFNNVIVTTGRSINVETTFQRRYVSTGKFDPHSIHSSQSTSLFG